MTDSRTFPIAPAPLAPLLLILAPVAAIVAYALVDVWRSPTAPAIARIGITATTVLTGALLGSALRGARAARVALDARGLRLVGDVYGRRPIPYDALQVADARVVDLAVARELRPTLRTFGTGLPGYAGGWFATASGRALCALTRRDRVLAVPTRRGHTLLLSARDPDALLAALRERQGPETRTAPTA